MVIFELGPPVLTLHTFHAHSTNDIINSFHEESKSEIEF